MKSEKASKQLLVEAWKTEKKMLLGVREKGALAKCTVKILMALSPVIVWKREKVPNDLMDLARESCRQNVKGAKWLLLAAYYKIQVEGN